MEIELLHNDLDYNYLDTLNSHPLELTRDTR